MSSYMCKRCYYTIAFVFVEVYQIYNQIEAMTFLVISA